MVFTYGIFVLRNGGWVLWETYPTQAGATQELRYLVDQLGLAAKLFRRPGIAP